MKIWRGAGMSERHAHDKVPSRATLRSLQTRAWKVYLQGRRQQGARLAFKALKRRRSEGLDPLLEAGLWYLVGVGRGNSRAFLQRSLRVIRDALASGADQAAPLRRMEAEALLRLRDYRAAFEVFAEIASASSEDLHVAAFRLRHDVLLLGRLVAVGRIDAAAGLHAAGQLRQALTVLNDQDGAKGHLWWALVSDLPADVRALLRDGLYDRLITASMPDPQKWQEKDPLNRGIEWAALEQVFLDKGLVIVDDFFGPDALAELWRYCMEATCFRSLRPGYLGAFPWDGCVHPLLRCAVEGLEDRLRRALHGRPLARWWLFKYVESQSPGVGVHADEAAVNVNVWLTPTSACRRGGGLEVYKHVPRKGTWTGDFNRVRGDAGEDQSFRTVLKSHGFDYVGYKQNRACIFASDRFHASEPFEFVDGHPRLNLTLLFGDRSDLQQLPTRRSSTTSMIGRRNQNAFHN